MPTREQLEAFLEVAERRSIQGAARATGRARATYLRHLEELRSELDAPVLLQRARGRRLGILTPAGEELARRARIILQHWDRWEVSTRDAIARTHRLLRVGALAGSFDLIAELLAELRVEQPTIELKITEYPDESLSDAVVHGAIDVGLGSLHPEGVPEQLEFRAFGQLAWAVIVPSARADEFPSRIRLEDLDGVPMVVMRAGAARDRLERHFSHYRKGPLVLDAAFEVGSSPRVVEMVARGFGPAIVSQFRLAFLPGGVVVRPLVDGPAPLTAGAYVRSGFPLHGPAERLLTRAKRRFRELAKPSS